jgi:hypothetical protein
LNYLFVGDHYKKNIMIKLYILLATVLLTAAVWGQSPQKMNYQEVIRNGSNLVTNHAVGMKISILQGSESGTSVYIETQTAITNGNGLVTVEIGGGTKVSLHTFAEIDWTTGPYYIKSETDPSGGTTYTITGTSQILSVPYALYVKTVASYNETDPIFTAWNRSTGISITASQVSDFQSSVTNNTAVLANTAKNSYPTADASKLAGIDGSETKISTGTNVTATGTGTLLSPYVINSTGERYIGEFYGGGIVVVIYKNAGVEHGLIASLTNLGPDPGSPWCENTYMNTLIGPAAQSLTDGQANTIAIIAQSGGFACAAKLCADYTNPEIGTGVYSDWYLPSIKELKECYDANFTVTNILGTTDGFRFDNYWSSTENPNDVAGEKTSYFIGFHIGILNPGGHKSHNLRVRAVRKF